MTYERPGLTAFVPQGEDRRATARMLVELAAANKIDQHQIQSSNDGFYISEELADLIGSEPEDSGTTEYTAGDTDKSVPATQTDPQTNVGRGDSTEGGGQQTKAEIVHDENGNAVGTGTTNSDEAPAETAPKKKRK